MKRMVWLVLLLLLIVPVRYVAAANYGFVVETASLERDKDEFRLNADIDYRFSQRAIEALKHSVPLTVVVRVQLRRWRRFVWDERVMKIALPYRIRYHALTKTYQVVNDSSGVERNFAGLEAAIDGLGRIRQMPLIKVDRLLPGYRYEMLVQADLDIESLPLPLRSTAYLTPQWYLGSAWYRWTFER